MNRGTRVITFGTYDLLHEGHIRLLERARALGDYLIVGVSTDALNSKKGKRSIFSQSQRLAYVKALKCVDEVFLEESLELKDEYVKHYRADLLVMGDDWQGKFDWIGCKVTYLPRTDGVSSTEIKTEISDHHRCKRVLFADTMPKKHYDCALSFVNELTAANIAPIFTNTETVPLGIDCDGVVYFTLPRSTPPAQYDDKPRVLIDHGASHLKWFLANPARFDCFDVFLTAGPDHVRALECFFPGRSAAQKIRAVGFVKSGDLLSAPRLSRADIAAACGLDPDKPITLFAPTWHLSDDVDITAAIRSVAAIDNHVASFHPNTRHLDLGGVNKVASPGVTTTELIKHADCLVSDFSSTIYEAAALGKPVVQVLLREYPDNPATLFDFPYTAGTAELFCGGITCRPRDIADVVRNILEKGVADRKALRLMQERILRGTFIRDNASKDIAAELARLCNSWSRPDDKQGTGAPAAARPTSKSRQNQFYAKSRMIAHGGGLLEGRRLSNWREAVSAALKAVGMVELDFVTGADGVVVAPGGSEAGALPPLSLEDAVALATAPRKALVCAIGASGDAYAATARAIHETAAARDGVERAVIQCYSVQDFAAALDIGFRRCLLATEKFFGHAPFGDETFAFIAECIRINADAVTGLGFPYRTEHLARPIVDFPEFERLHAFWKRIFIRGAPVASYPSLLRRNLGLFADAYSDDVAFKDHPDSFDWREYLFLNPDLVEAGCDNEVDATLHYLRCGRTENRLARYNVPKDFASSGYLTLNPRLRAEGVIGENSAKAHWTLTGCRAGAKYRRG